LQCNIASKDKRLLLIFFTDLRAAGRPMSHGHAKPILPHILIEVFFAILPLFVLASFWPDHGQEHPKNFWWGPEVSMTACILYGLTISRFIMGIIHSGTRGTAASVAPRAAAMALVPILGLIASIVLIAKLSVGTDSWVLLISQYTNLFLSVFSFLILGGYGLRHAA
jgi:hypothetical protein